MSYKNVFLIVIFLTSFFYYSPKISADASYHITNHTSYIDAKGTYHIIGEIENNGSINLLFIRITATFYNIDRQAIATNFTYSNLSMLLVGEKTSFNLLFMDTTLIPLIAGYTLEVDFQETSSTKPIQLVIKSHHNYTDVMNSQRIIGEVENQGSFTELVKVLVIGYDGYGRAVATEFMYTNPINLDHSQSAQFNLTIPHDRASLIKGYIIIAESQDYHSNMIINVYVPIIVMFKEDQILDLLKNLGGDINYVCQFKPAISGLINMGLIDTLRKHPAVEYIVYDIPIEPFEQTLPWGVERIGAPVVHTSGNKGTGINVAVLDTGIDTDHPDLSFVFGFDFSGRYIDDPDPQDFKVMVLT